MDEMTGLVRIVAIIGAAFMVLVTTFGIKADRETQAIARMVAAGADPIAAKCSLQSADGRDPICVAYVARDNAATGR